MESFLTNILQPPILLFFLGILAVYVKSDLDIPQPLPKFFSLYLLIAIGLHGGYELSHNGLSSDVLKVLLLAIFMALIVPVYTFFILRTKLDLANAVAVAATYGSISAVTFITAVSFLQSMHVSFGGYMVAAMALMESPAIIVGLLLFTLFGKNQHPHGFRWRTVFREAFFNSSVFILLGCLIVGYWSGENGWESMKPLFGDLFKGMLAFFLLDMGIVAARRFSEVTKFGLFPLLFALLVPFLNAALAILLAKLAQLSEGDAFLFAILSASASYIAVPAAMRLSIPKANPALYVTLSLAVTFPLNITIGIPVYFFVVQSLWG